MGRPAVGTACVARDAQEVAGGGRGAGASGSTTGDRDDGSSSGEEGGDDPAAYESRATKNDHLLSRHGDLRVGPCGGLCAPRGGLWVRLAGDEWPRGHCSNERGLDRRDAGRKKRSGIRSTPRTVRTRSEHENSNSRPPLPLRFPNLDLLPRPPPPSDPSSPIPARAERPAGHPAPSDVAGQAGRRGSDDGRRGGGRGGRCGRA